MKLARFYIPDTNQSTSGLIENNSIKPIKNTIFEESRVESGPGFKLRDVKLAAPVDPTKIILVGLNYKDHAKELGMNLPDEPIIFLKPSTSILGPNEDIIYPAGVERLDYEAELAIVIKKRAKSIQENEVPSYILGYTCLNDVTARDLQRKDTQWTRAKSFDTFCPVGPSIETELGPSNLDIKLYLNGEIKQSSNTTNLIFPVEKLVSFISGVMTLLPGDIIATGTPPGVGPMKEGDTVRVEIEGIGSLINKVAK